VLLQGKDLDKPAHVKKAEIVIAAGTAALQTSYSAY
jgi:hypothetical protein